VARNIAEARPRARVVATGTIRNTKAVDLGHSTAYECLLDDGTGELTLVFVGRSSVPGLVVSARCTVEGTARYGAGHLEVWNPRYRLDPDQP
jgi:RecG-like helicase